MKRSSQIKQQQLGVVHKLRLPQEWVGGFTKVKSIKYNCQPGWVGGSKKGKNV